MRYVPYVYFLRIPLIFAILLLLLPVTGLWWKSAVQGVVRGMFDLQPWGAFNVSLVTLLYGGALSVQTSLVLLYGRMRFAAAKLDARHLETVFHIGGLEVPRVLRGFLLSYGLCCGALIFGVISGGTSTEWHLRAGAVLAALAVFAVIVYLLVRLWKRVGSERTTFIAKRLTWTPWGFLKRRKTDGAQEVPLGKQQWGFEEPPQLLPGHGFAALLLLFSAVVYGVFALAQWKVLDAVEKNSTSPGTALIFPTLGSAVVLFGLLVWALGFLAFLLDRYRIPVFVPLAAMFVLTAQFTKSDHYFDVQTLQDGTPHSTVEALKPRSDGMPDSAIVVTAAGGGIKAAAWTAQVLKGLVDLMPASFAPSIRVISSVSGGSVGALYFIHAYENGTITKEKAEEARRASMASSLDEVGWGLVYPDVWRSVMPLLLSPRIDRAWALETTWLREMMKIRAGLFPTLGSWRADARNQTRPAVIFNTTTVESGERFLFSTVDLAQAPGRHSFHDLLGHGNLDLRANTAARLSATFPYVTPVSRANCCGPRNQRFHFADGGYHDNFGIASASELLRQAFASGEPVVKRILMIQVMLDTPPPDPTAEGGRGWFFQTFAPLATLLKMRDAAQFTRNQTEISLLTDVLRSRGVDMKVVQFPYPHPVPSEKRPDDETEPPVSWHMTDSDSKGVAASWARFVVDQKPCTELERIRQFLGQAPQKGVVCP